MLIEIVFRSCVAAPGAALEAKGELQQMSHSMKNPYIWAAQPGTSRDLHSSHSDGRSPLLRDLQQECVDLHGNDVTLGWQNLAQHYREVGFVKMYGNASEAAKHLFKDRLKARVTPTFYLFRNGAPPPPRNGVHI